MSGLKQTNEFVDIKDDEISLDLDLNIDDDLNLSLDFGVDDLEDGLGLSLDFNQPDDVNLELVKVSESGYDILKSIEEDNYRYEHVSSTKEIDMEKMKRTFILKTIDYCKSSDANKKLCMNASKDLKESIHTYIDQSMLAVKSSQRMNYTLSTLLMTKGIEFDLDMACKTLDEDFREFINHLCIIEDQASREEIINSTGNFLKIDLDKISDYSLGIVNRLKYTAETKEMVVTCPNCGKEYVHDLIQSTKCMNDAIRGEVYLKHNPLICDECSTVSVMDSQSILICKQHIIQAIDDTDEDERYRAIAPIDVAMLSKLSEAEISYPEEKVLITDKDVQHFVTLQQTKIDMYDKKFYGNLLSNPKNKDERNRLYNYNAFYQLGVTDREEMELYLIGGICRTGYFTILKELYDEKTKYISRLLEVAKIQNFIGLVQGTTVTEIDNLKKAELEIDFGIKALEESLAKLNIDILGIEDFTVENAHKICELISPVLRDCKDKCLVSLNSLEDKVNNTVEFLKGNACELFRFVNTAKGDKFEYYKVFNSIEQGKSLLRKVYPIMMRHIWDFRVVEKFLSTFSTVSRLKNKITDKDKDVKKSVDKLFGELRNVKTLQDQDSMVHYSYIGDMPREYIALAASVDNRDYYRFVYTILLLKSIEPPAEPLAKDIYDIINATDIDQAIVEIFNQQSSSPDFDKFKDDVCEYLANTDNAVTRALFGDKLSLFDNKELVCKLNLCKYINNFLNSKNLDSVSSLFVRACVTYVDKSYVVPDMCTLINYMTYFDEDTEVIMNDDIQQIEIDFYNGSQLANKLLKSVNSFSRRFVESVDEETNTVSLDQYDQLKILYSELPKDFKYLREFTLYMLNDFGDTTEDFRSTVNLVDSSLSEVMNMYLSCLTDVKTDGVLLKELRIDRSMFDVYKEDFYRFIEKVKGTLTPRAKVEFELLINKLV